MVRRRGTGPFMHATLPSILPSRWRRWISAARQLTSAHPLAALRRFASTVQRPERHAALHCQDHTPSLSWDDDAASHAPSRRSTAAERPSTLNNLHVEVQLTVEYSYCSDRCVNKRPIQKEPHGLRSRLVSTLRPARESKGLASERHRHTNK